MISEQPAIDSRQVPKEYTVGVKRAQVRSQAQCKMPEGVMAALDEIDEGPGADMDSSASKSEAEKEILSTLRKARPDAHLTLANQGDHRPNEHLHELPELFEVSPFADIQPSTASRAFEHRDIYSDSQSQDSYSFNNGSQPAIRVLRKEARKV